MNNPEILRRLREQFVPVTTALTDPSFAKSPAGQWFRRTADAHKEPNGHDQGFYILTADGYGPPRLFDYPAWHPPGVLKFMDEGLALVKAHRVSAAGVADLHEGNLRAPHIAQPEAGTAVIRQFSRMPGAPAAQLNASPDRDHLWIFPEEIKEILARARSAAGAFPLPESLAARLARFQLIDDVGGRSTVFTGPEHVKRAAFFARANQRGPRRWGFTFAGSWACGTQDGAIGIEGKVEGEFEVDEAAAPPRLSRFRAFAEADAWGGGSHGVTEMPPPGRFRLVFAFVEADDALARGVPPAFAHLPAYRHAWHWLTPGAGRR